jgi:hypothetical protein
MEIMTQEVQKNYMKEVVNITVVLCLNNSVKMEMHT